MAKINPKKKSSDFVEDASTNKKKYKRKKYPKTLTVRLKTETEETIKAIAYYNRESQRETIERALDLLKKDMGSNEVEKARDLYNEDN